MQNPNYINWSLASIYYKLIRNSNEMTLEAIDGKTPNEAFNNINPFPDRLNCLFKKAFTERIKENQNSNCIPYDLSLIK